MSARIRLTREEAEAFCRPINGQGGFQSLLRGLRQHYDPETRTLRVTDAQIERIRRYTSDYGWGGFEGRLEGLRRNLPDLADG